MYDHVHYKQRAEWTFTTYNSSILIIFHVHIVLTSQAAAVRFLGPYVLSRASTRLYIHLHVVPPRDGGPRVIPVVLKGPLMSFSILSRCILSWQGQDILSTLVNFRGRHVFLLSVISSA